MNKKLLFAMALPLTFAACSQDELINEPASPQVKGSAITGLTLNIEKESGAETRATMGDDGVLSYENTDKLSLYWLGSDGASHDATAETQAASNAVYYTEDGANFQSQSVVYEGYNLLVFPADLAHVTKKTIDVALPQIQTNPEDYVKNWVYVSDSVLQIHKPVLVGATSKKWKDPFYGTVYGNEADFASAEDIIASNTAGYGKGLALGTKPLQTAIQLKLRIKNAPAGTNVIVNRVEFASEAAMFSTKGNITAGTQKVVGTTVLPNAASKAMYLNPWYASTEAKSSVGVDCSNIEINDNELTVTMLMNPIVANMIDIAYTTNGTPTYTLNSTNGKQPKLKVYTNYGIVTIGGSDAGNNNQLRAIFKKDGTTVAAVSDNQALLDMIGVTNRLSYKQVATNKYRIKNKGWFVPRVVDVDLNNADIDGMHVKNNTELNNILNAARQLNKAALTIYLDAASNKKFTLTDLSALSAYTGALTLKDGSEDLAAPHANDLQTIVVNTTSGTVLPKIAVTEVTPNCTIEIPAASSITTLSAGTQSTQFTYTQTIVNKKTTGLTMGAYSNATVTNKNAVLTLANGANVAITDNTKGTINYVSGATILNVSAAGGGPAELTTANYGTIAYTAATHDAMKNAMTKGVNQVTINNINLGFFSEGIDATLNSYPAVAKGGIEVIFNNCGDLKDLSSLKAGKVTLKGGTKSTKLSHCTVTEWNLYDTTTLGKTLTDAKFASPATNIAGERDAIGAGAGRVNVKGGTATINGINVNKLAVYAGATAVITKHAWAPANLAVEGTVTYNASGNAGDLKVNNDGNVVKNSAAANELTTLVVTGRLTTNQDIVADNVWIGTGTIITVAGNGVQGVAANSDVYATRYEQIDGTSNFTSFAAAVGKHIWSGSTADWDASF